MPISREELEQGHFDVSLPIARLLADRPALGFGADEIQQLLMDLEGRNTALDEVEKALEALVARARVQMWEVGGRRWYTIVQRRLGFQTELE